MPSQINVQLTGRIGDLIFYKMGDKYYTRSAPSRVKQTKATKKRATEFGKASRLGRSLRQQLLPVIPFPRDNQMQTRLVSALFQWLKSATSQLKPSNLVPFVSSYQFTNGSTIHERWKVALEVTHKQAGLIEVKIPAFIPLKAISAPANTVSVTCRIGAAGCNIGNGMATGAFISVLNFNYDNTEVPAQTLEFSFPTPSGSLVVTAISLQYNFMKNGYLERTTNKAFMPAGVVSAMYL